ncbi:PREDICTED: uncharacterized protein LOC109215203 [Nicotiana attenuata]|uniref:uncharacterized protein LOC109215203 n=1 Tax=Nicotiana attenuata TaxID=49451 RepID=UPI000904D943|nr:PREDICTED: uncharacterized protein LOC109215203 [Nicotiana attenuata]
MKHGTTLSHQQRVDLCAEVTNQEIVESLKAIGDDKDPGIDGFNFFKKAWDIISMQIIDAMKECFSTEKLYKAITVLLLHWCLKLQKVIPYIICEAQAGFILCRKIVNNVILSHELVKVLQTRAQISPRCMNKIDLQKAYDSVEWIFLQQVMEDLRFTDRFIRWIMECIKTVNYTILVNKETTEPFIAAKDLRQGDHISPFLFAIVMEYFSRSLHGLKKEPDFQYHPRCRKLGITHANLGKSSVYFGGVKQAVKDHIMAQLGFTSGSLLFKYTCIPLSTKKIALIQWQPLI